MSATSALPLNPIQGKFNTMNDDVRFKILIYTMVLLFAVAVIGIWESFIKPLISFFTDYISFV